jgi:DNA-binding MarR family transcriptional regulator
LSLARNRDILSGVQYILAGYTMIRDKSEKERLNELVEAFTELGPTWVRWVNTCLPDDAVSYVRMRLLTTLLTEGEQSMGQIAAGLCVTPRRVTSLVEALEPDGLVERRPHPTDGRSTLVALTDAGLKAQHLGWKQHRSEVAEAFGDLSIAQQEQLLTISRSLTQAMRVRLAGRSAPPQVECQIACEEGQVEHGQG